MDDTKSCYQLIISIIKLEKVKGENVLEKELTTVSRYLKRTYSSVTDPSRARALTHTVQLLRHDAYTVQLLRHDAYTVQLHCPDCPINAQIMAGDSQSDSRILL